VHPSAQAVYNVGMRLALFALAGAVFAATSFAAEPRWIRLESPNFEIYSTASEGSTRDTLKQFEQVRAFFISALPTKDEKPLPVRIVQFSSDKEYQPYRFNSSATAYYKSGEERDTIVMSHGGPESFPISIHEYVHLVMRHAGLKLPPWLNEGMAELYSTLQQVGNRVTVGGVIPGRLAEIQQKKWVPLSVILGVDQNSPYFNEKNRVGRFYSESWALTHMLCLSIDYRPKWRDFVKAIVGGKSSTDALTSTYGKSITAIEEDLQLYVQGRNFRTLIYDAKLEQIEQKYAAEPAPAFDVKLMLLDIVSGNTREQTEQELGRLAAEEPSRPEPYVQLGYLAWGAGKRAGPEVREQFEKAYSLGGRSPRMLWDYGRIMVANRPADAARVLTELSALEPERRDVKIELPRALLNAGQPDAAVKTILSLDGCTPEEAVRCVSTAGYAYLRLDQRDQAQHAAELYLKVAQTPEDRQSAQQLLDTLKRPPATTTARIAPQPADSESPPGLDPEELLKRAAASLQKRNFAAARETLAEIEQLNPREQGLWALYGSLYAAQNQRDQAIEAFRKEIALYPNSLPPYARLAGVRRQAGRTDDEIETWRQALLAAPGNVAVVVDLADALMRAKRYPEAIEKLEVALAGAPGDVRLEEAEFKVHLRAGNESGVRATLTKLREAKLDPAMENSVGYALADANVEAAVAQEISAKAVVELEEQMSKSALATLTNDDVRRVLSLGAFWDTLGWAYFRNSDFAHAETYVGAAWNLRQDATASDHLGQVYEREGKKKEAIHAYELALAVKKDLPETRERLAKLCGAAVASPSVASAPGAGKQLPISPVVELQRMRSVSVPGISHPSGSAEVVLLLSPTGVVETRFISGDEKLKDAPSVLLKTAAFGSAFPDSGPERIARRGILSCTQNATPNCTLVLLLPANTQP
jgi:tetratricopeptide (TPR) repeat protein